MACTRNSVRGYKIIKTIYFIPIYLLYHLYVPQYAFIPNRVVHAYYYDIIYTFKIYYPTKIGAVNEARLDWCAFK